MTIVYYQMQQQNHEPPQPVSEEQYRTAIASAVPIVRDVMAGAACKPEDYQAPKKEKKASEMFPEYARMRAVARVASAYATEEIKKGNVRKGLEVLVDNTEMGTDIGRGTFLIGGLVGHAIQAIALKPLKDTIDSVPISAADARFVAIELARIDSERPSFQENMTLDYEMGRNTLVEVLTEGNDNIIGYAGGVPHKNPWKGIEWKIYINMPGIKTMIFNRFEDIWKKQIELSGKPYPESANMAELAEEIPRYDLINRMMLPAYFRANMSDVKTQTLLRGVALMYALEGFKAETGKYPESLDALSEAGIFAKEPVAEITIDPFSNKPFIYQKTEEDYKLYSVGPDMQDNLGLPAHIYEIRTENAFDFVFQKGVDIYDKDAILKMRRSLQPDSQESQSLPHPRKGYSKKA